MTNDEVEFLAHIVTPLVKFPEDVKIDRRTDDMGVLLTLSLNPQDIGSIIGRMGQTAKAIRLLLRCYGASRKARINMKINEPEGGRNFGPRQEQQDFEL